MSCQSRGIVLQHFRYGDSSLIVKLFSEEHGLLTFMVKGALNRSSRFKPALFQPLSMLYFVANLRPGKDFQYFTEVSVDWPYQSLNTHPVKRTLVLFLAELLSKTLHEQGPNSLLYDFVHNSLLWFDLQHDHFTNFHLHFMLELSRFLGFYPRMQSEPDWQVFDLIDGSFRQQPAGLQYFINRNDALLLRQLATSSLQNLSMLRLTVEQRRRLLDILVLYYQLHLPVFKGLHSHEILRSLL